MRNDSFFDKFVFKKIQEQLGGRVKLLVTGSAPISENVMKFARAALGCVVLEGYGENFFIKLAQRSINFLMLL